MADPTQAQQTASQLTQPAYMQGVSTVNPATASYNPTQTSQLSPQLLQSLSPNATIQQILQSFAPQQQQSTQNLNQMLADYGVSGGQAIQAGQQLQGQLASSIAPALAQAIQGSQANQLGAGEFNSNALNNVGLSNSGNALQAALANASGANQANMFNATGLNNLNAANTAQFNTSQQQLLQDLLNNYNSQLGAQVGILGQGQNAGNQNAVNYGQTITETPSPFQSIFGGLSAAAGFI